MSQFDAAPPNTYAGGNDDALRTKGNDPVNAPTTHGIADERVNMEEYERTVPLWKRVWQNSLTQMFLLSIQAFCGPAMADAIAGMQSEHVQTRPNNITKYLQDSVEVVSQPLRRPTSLPRSTTLCLQSAVLLEAPS
jgi:hypothetical protein